MEEIEKIKKEAFRDQECYQITTRQCRTGKRYTYFVPVDRIKELDDDDKSYNFFPGTRELRPRYIKDFDRFFLSRYVGSLHLYINDEKFSPDAEFYLRRLDQFIKRSRVTRWKEFEDNVARWAESTCVEFYNLYYQQGQPTWEEILNQYRDELDIFSISRSQKQDGKLPLPYRWVKRGGKFYGCYYDDEMRKRPLTTPKSIWPITDYIQILLRAYYSIVINDWEWIKKEAVLKEVAEFLSMIQYEAKQYYK